MIRSVSWIRNFFLIENFLGFSVQGLLESFVLEMHMFVQLYTKMVLGILTGENFAGTQVGGLVRRKYKKKKMIPPINRMDHCLLGNI